MEEPTIEREDNKHERRQNAIDIREIKSDLSGIKKSISQIDKDVTEKLNSHETRLSINEMKLQHAESTFEKMRHEAMQRDKRLNDHFHDESEFQKKVIWLLISIVVSIFAVIAERIIENLFF